MADPRIIDSCLDDLAAAYGKHPNWVTAARPLWVRMFVQVANADLQAACRAWMEDPEHEHAPPPAKIRALLGSSGPITPACGTCAGGWREVAVHRRDAREANGVRITVGVCRCECALGEAIDAKPDRRPRAPDLAGQVRHLEADPSVLAFFVDPSAAQRRNLEEPAPVARSAAIAHVRGLMLGRDAETRHSAAQRARTLSAEHEREEGVW
jgi:hypothetical protein